MPEEKKEQDILDTNAVLRNPEFNRRLRVWAAVEDAVRTAHPELDTLERSLEMAEVCRNVLALLQGKFNEEK